MLKRWMPGSEVGKAAEPKKKNTKYMPFLFTQDASISSPSCETLVCKTLWRKRQIFGQDCVETSQSLESLDRPMAATTNPIKTEVWELGR